MPVNLSKVQKKIIKKKGKDAIHENSRDSKTLRRAGGREEKLAKAASVAMRARRSYTNRVDFFKERLPEDDAVVAISDEELLNGTIAYLSRLDDEIAHLESEQRKNRPPVKRLVDLREAKQAEQRELDTGGFWVPDMTDEIS
ncbi:DNA-dependent RNA polymerase II, partial [Ascosphaera pollenicola]